MPAMGGDHVSGRYGPKELGAPSPSQPADAPQVSVQIFQHISRKFLHKLSKDQYLKQNIFSAKITHFHEMHLSVSNPVRPSNEIQKIYKIN